LYLILNILGFLQFLFLGEFFYLLDKDGIFCFSSLAIICCLYLVATTVFCSSSQKLSSHIILFWAILFRALPLIITDGQVNHLSSDINRYFWEGRVVANNYNPFLNSPESIELREFARSNMQIWSKVEHKEVPALYPPFAQFIFSKIPAEIKWYQRVNFVLEVILLFFLLYWISSEGLAPSRLLYYAWLPLPIIELTYSAHLEGFFILPMAMAIFFSRRAKQVNNFKIYRELLSGLFFSLAIGIKYVAAVPLLFVFASRLRNKKDMWRQVVIFIILPSSIVAFGFFPYLNDWAILSGLGAYTKRWSFNGFFYQMFTAFFDSKDNPQIDVLIRGGLALYMAFVVGALAIRVVSHSCEFEQAERQVIKSTILGFLCILLLSPVVYPWYLLWFAFLLPLIKSNWQRNLTAVFCCSVFLSYEVLSHPFNWQIDLRLVFVEYFVVILALIPELFRSRVETQAMSGHR
jgi:alpha-1,6-mannosyltransferase